jgi:TolB protein
VNCSRIIAEVPVLGAILDGIETCMRSPHSAIPAFEFRTADKAGKGLRIETGEIKVLTEGDQTDNFPDWSPKGDWICFTSNREDKDYGIYLIRPDGTGMKRLTHLPGNDGHSTRSPDSEWIAFSSGRGGFKDEMALHPDNPQSYGEITVMRRRLDHGFRWQ